MAMAGEGESSYRGGAGGKFQKRPHRRPQSTPYDRPKSIVRNPTGEGWLSKLVDPASKFISASAFKFFSNFRKRLTEGKQEPEDGHQEAAPMLTDCNGAREQDIACNGNANNSSESSGISDLEQMLKQKTFTRTEVDRLTELLHSRKVEFQFRDEVKKNEGDLLQPVSDLKKQVSARSPLLENRGDVTKFQRNISSTGVSSRVLEDDIASPAELAKAYMGSRPSKVSPSVLGVRGQALKEESPLLTNGVFPTKSSALTLVSKSGLNGGNPEKGFTTPRSRGRSAIYNMARTPYSRGTASTNYIYGGPSSSSSSPQSGWEHNGQLGSKQLALKRRSSALEDESGSVGAIRRIRQKPNLSYHSSSLSARGTDFGHRAGLRHTSFTDKPLLLDDARIKVLKNGEECVDDSVAGNKYSHIPSQSSQMASKILQHLEKLTPPQKSSDSKLVTARDKSPIKLTPNMLHGPALRSLENVESTKFLQNQDDWLKDSSNVLPDAGGETSGKNTVGENGSKEASIPHKLKASSIGGDSKISTTDVARLKNADSIASKYKAQPPQARRTFRMSANEDFPELDDGTYTNGFVSPSSGEGRKELQTSRSFFPTLSIAAEKTSSKPEFKTPESLTAVTNNVKSSGGPVVAKENTGNHGPAPVAAVSNFQQDIPIQSASAVNNSVPSRDTNPSSSLSQEKIDTVPSFTFSSAPPCTESPDPNNISRPDTKRQSFGSDSQQKVLEVDKVDVKNKAGSASQPSDNSTAATASNLTSGFVSSTLSAEKSILNNGWVASSPFSFSSSAPTLTSSNSVEKISSNGFPIQSSNSAIMTTVSTSTSDPTVSTVLPPSLPSAPDTSPPSFFSAPAASPPSFSSAPAAAPIFSFGSSLTQSTPAATFSSSPAVESSGIKSNDAKDTLFGNLTNTPSGGTSFAMTNAGSNIFGFSSLNGSSSSNNSTTVSSQVPPATGTSTVTQSVPFQFGSSGSSTIFGTSGITSFAASNSVIDSAGPTAKPFGTGTTFAISATTSPLFSNTPSSTSSSSSSIFSSSWQTSKSPVIGSAVSSPSPTPAFSFGAASTSGAPTSNASMVFGQSTGASSGSLFSFTSATSSTSSFPSLSQSQPVFGNATAFKAPGTSGDQMNMEDSMAEDPVQSSAPTAPVFGQPPAPPSTPGFMFGSTTPLQLPSPSTSPFQFGGQPNQAPPPNLSPFQASNSQDFNSGGSFSLGSGGGDKGARKTVRVSRIRNRKK